MKVLCLDIETRPIEGWFWGLYDQNIAPSQIEVPTEMLCFAAKWLGEKGTRFFSRRDGTKLEVAEAAHELLDKADVVMHYNGKKFDSRHLNREFIEVGLTPPSPYRHLDLMVAVKKVFALPSYKLEYVAKWLGIGEKVKHDGFDTWIGCMNNDPAAWALMEKYNRQDAALLEDLYYALQPWIPQHPSFGAFLGQDVCPNCGSAKLEKRGYAHTDVSTFQQYRCKECGKWSRSTKRSSATTIREVNVA